MSTERPIATGSGVKLRRAYTVILGGVVIFLTFVAFMPLNWMIRWDQIPTAVFLAGAAAAVAGFGLLITAILRGRAAVAGDTVSVTGMRSSGRLAAAAQVVGLAGFLMTIVVGFLLRRDADLSWPAATVLALCVGTPGVLGDSVRRLSLRFAIDQGIH